MKTQKPNAELVWKQFTDFLIPQFKLTITDRAVYWHLIRHSRLEGEPRLRFSIGWISRGIRLSASATRHALRRLVSIGALRLVMRSRAGHLVAVRLPEEIPNWREAVMAARGKPSKLNLEIVDFFRSRTLRKAIHSREGGVCFYCMKEMKAEEQCLDHVRPQSKSGRNSYRNLVSCCIDCNSQKGQRPAKDLLRSLYRKRRLSAPEFTKRLRALDALAAGKLRPVVDQSASEQPRIGRPRLDPRERRSGDGTLKSLAAGKRRPAFSIVA